MLSTELLPAHWCPVALRQSFCFAPFCVQAKVAVSSQVRRIRVTADYYEILGLRKGASEEDLKRACKQSNPHPDIPCSPTAFARNAGMDQFLSLPRIHLMWLPSADRKLALKLHPDKCTAHGADEAFKGMLPMQSDQRQMPLQLSLLGLLP